MVDGLLMHGVSGRKRGSVFVCISPSNEGKMGTQLQSTSRKGQVSYVIILKRSSSLSFRLKFHAIHPTYALYTETRKS